MKYFIIIASAIIIVIVIIFLINKLIERKNDNKISDLLNKYQDRFDIVKVKKKSYDYVLRLKGFDIYVRTLMIPNDSQICINAKETWVLNTSYSQRTHSYTSHRFIDEMEYFLKNDIITNRRNFKLILLNRKPKQIIRYLNEIELEEVDINKTPYNYKITSIDTFNQDIDIILKDFQNFI